MLICIIEDDTRLAAVLQQAFEEDGANVTHLSSGEDAASYIAASPFDAVVLDITLRSKTDGLMVLQQLRRLSCQIPVLVLSARDTVPEMVRALDLGADDYMTKPFHLDLLLARVRSVARRGMIPQAIELIVGPLTLHPNQWAAQVQGVLLDLTRTEYTLLETLLRRAGQVVTRTQLIEAVWGLEAEVSKGNLDFHVHSVRTKLGPACEGLVRTVRGVGYRVERDSRSI